MKILIVDDNENVRTAIKYIVSRLSQKFEIYEASHGLDAIKVVSAIHFDIILMDISMGDMDGISTTKQIIEKNPKQNIIGVSMHTDAGDVMKMKEAGAMGYIFKDEVNEKLQETINLILEGRTVFPETKHI